MLIWLLRIALTAYANGLDNFTMSVYLQEAASEFNGIVQYTTLAVIQSMILGVGKPIFAKLANTFGRAFTYAISILFFTVGTIVISSSRSIQGLGAGMVFFSIGNTGITFSQSVTIADLVGVRWRTTIGNVFAIHFVINFGIASKITAAMIPDRWRWGVGMFTIINPFVTAPIITVLGLQQWRAYKAGQLAPYPYRGMGFWTALRALASDLDLIGLFTMAGGFLLILLPLTIADALRTATRPATSSPCSSWAPPSSPPGPSWSSRWPRRRSSTCARSRATPTCSSPPPSSSATSSATP